MFNLDLKQSSKDPRSSRASRASRSLKIAKTSKVSQRAADWDEKRSELLKPKLSLFDDEYLKQQYLSRHEPAKNTIFQKNKRLEQTYQPVVNIQLNDEKREDEDWLFDLDDDEFDAMFSDFISVSSDKSSESTGEEVSEHEKETEDKVLSSSNLWGHEQDFNGKKTTAESPVNSTPSGSLTSNFTVKGYLERYPSDLTRSLGFLSVEAESFDESKQSLPESRRLQLFLGKERSFSAPAFRTSPPLMELRTVQSDNLERRLFSSTQQQAHQSSLDAIKKQAPLKVSRRTSTTDLVNYMALTSARHYSPPPPPPPSPSMSPISLSAGPSRRLFTPSSVPQTPRPSCSHHPSPVLLTLAVSSSSPAVKLRPLIPTPDSRPPTYLPSTSVVTARAFQKLSTTTTPRPTYPPQCTPKLLPSTPITSQGPTTSLLSTPYVQSSFTPSTSALFAQAPSTTPTPTFPPRPPPQSTPTHQPSTPIISHDPTASTPSPPYTQSPLTFVTKQSPRRFAQLPSTSTSTPTLPPRPPPHSTPTHQPSTPIISHGPTASTPSTPYTQSPLTCSTRQSTARLAQSPSTTPTPTIPPRSPLHSTPTHLPSTSIMPHDPISSIPSTPQSPFTPAPSVQLHATSTLLSESGVHPTQSDQLPLTPITSPTPVLPLIIVCPISPSPQESPGYLPNTPLTPNTLTPRPSSTPPAPIPASTQIPPSIPHISSSRFPTYEDLNNMSSEAKSPPNHGLANWLDAISFVSSMNEDLNYEALSSRVVADASLSGAGTDKVQSPSDTSSTTQQAIAENIETVQRRLNVLSESLAKRHKSKQDACATGDCVDSKYRAKKIILKLIQYTLTEYVSYLKERREKNIDLPTQELPDAPTVQISMSDMICLPINLIKQISPCLKDLEQQSIIVHEDEKSSKHHAAKSADSSMSQIDSHDLDQSFSTSEQEDKVEVATPKRDSGRECIHEAHSVWMASDISVRLKTPQFGSSSKHVSPETDSERRSVETSSDALPMEQSSLTGKQDQINVRDKSELSNIDMPERDLDYSATQLNITTPVGKATTSKMAPQHLPTSSERECFGQNIISRTNSGSDFYETQSLGDMSHENKSSKMDSKQNFISPGCENTITKMSPKTDSKFDITQSSTDILPKETSFKMEPEQKLISQESKSSSRHTAPKVQSDSNAIELDSSELLEKRPSVSESAIILPECDSGGRLTLDTTEIVSSVIQVIRDAVLKRCSFLKKSQDQGIVSSEGKLSINQGLPKTEILKDDLTREHDGCFKNVSKTDSHMMSMSPAYDTSITRDLLDINSKSRMFHYSTDESTLKTKQSESGFLPMQENTNPLIANASGENSLTRTASNKKSPSFSFSTEAKTHRSTSKELPFSQQFVAQYSESTTLRSPGTSQSVHDQHESVTGQTSPRNGMLKQTEAKNEGQTQRDVTQTSPSLKRSHPSISSSLRSQTQSRRKYVIRTISKNIWCRGGYIIDDMPPIVSCISYKCPPPNTLIIRAPRNLHNRCKYIIPTNQGSKDASD